MNRKTKRILAAVMSALLLAGPSAAEPAPTFSLEATAINGTPVTGESKDTITVQPGDRIRADFFLRDWSTGDAGLRGYQIQIDEMSYRTGDAGWIEPVEFQAKRTVGAANTQHAYVDLTRPDYIFFGRQTVPVVDTVKTGGYRWISVLLDVDQAPIAPQDGSKFYCGTVELEVSPEAAGTFFVGPVPEEVVTTAVAATGQPIRDLQYESLEIRVAGGTGNCRIVSSSPPNRAIDARVPDRSATIELVVSCDASNLGAGDFRLDDGTDKAPRVAKVAVRDGRVILTLTKPMSAGRWTKISLEDGGPGVTIGALPGDVNNDGATTPADVISLINAISQSTPMADYQVDLDGDGSVSVRDINLAIELISPSRRSARHPQQMTGQP